MTKSLSMFAAPAPKLAHPIWEPWFSSGLAGVASTSGVLVCHGDEKQGALFERVRERAAGHEPGCNFTLGCDLRAAIHEYRPARVVLVGTEALRHATGGLYLDTTYIRRAWAYFPGGLVAFAVMDPVHGAHNRFHQARFDSDLEWAISCDPPALVRGETRVLDGRGAREYLRALEPRPVVVDVEHAGTLWSTNKQFRILCVGLCQDAEHPVVIGDEVLARVLPEFRAFLADPAYPKVGQNLKHDRHALFRYTGTDMVGIEWDTMIGQRLREPEAPAGLGALAWTVGMGGYKEAARDLSDEDEKGSARFASMSFDDLAAYNGRDTATTLLVRNQQDRSAHAKLRRTWQRFINPAFEALAVVERTGILLSADAVRAYDRWLEGKEQALDQSLRAYSEVPVGFTGTNAQVADLLYNKLGLTCEIKTDTGQQSVKAEALEALADKHAIVPLLLSLSRVKKQRSTYGLSMLEHISEVDGRVHTTFNMVRSARLSSKSPNVQNITAPEEPGGEGEWARGCFVAAPGNKLVSLDYAQQELRVAAMLSGDETMAASFEAGHDFHTMTAAAAHGVSPDAVTKEQRRVGKSLNFAIIFGQSEYGIARSIDSTKERAAELMATLLGRYSKFAAWRRGRVADAEVNGILWTEWGDWCFRRSVYGIGETARGKAADRIRKHWRNVAMNNPIQCIANCFCLASLTEAVRWTREERHEVKVVMTVHDSLLFECPEGLVDEVVREGRRIMLQWPSGVVKLKVDAEVGADWGRMVKVG